jgi:hypothetical protein
MGTFQYRLQVLLDEKIRAKETAQQSVLAAQRNLAVERGELDQCHRLEAAAQCAVRDARLHLLRQVTGVSAGDSIPLRRAHIERLGREYEDACGSRRAQELRVREAEERVEESRLLLALLSRRVEVLQKHRERLQEEFCREAERFETLAQEEMANVIYLRGRSRS